MTSLRLGLRLAAARGRVRVGMVALGTTVGTVVLLLAVSLPDAIRPAGDAPADSSQQRFAAVIVTAVAVPVVILLMTVTRLSAAARDRGLVALRLLGVPRRRTLQVAASEAGAHAVVGALLGSAVYLLLQPLLNAADSRWRSWFPHGLHIGTTALLAVVAGIPLLAIVVSLAPARALPTVSGRIQQAARRPSLWRLVPWLVGSALLSVALAGRLDLQSLSSALVFLLGAALAGIGVPLAVPVGVRLLADALVRFGRRPLLLLTGRRLQLEPATTTRIVAALLAATYVVVGARCVLAAFEQTPEYLHAAAVRGPGPQRVDLVAGDRPVQDAAVRSALAAVPGVRSVVAEYPALEERGADSRNAVRGTFGTCADLQAQLGVSGCRPGQPVWLLPTTEDGTAQGAPRTVRLAPLDDRQHTIAVTLPLPTLPIHFVVTDIYYQTSYPPGVFVPIDTPGARAAAGDTRRWTVMGDGGRAVVQRIRTATASLGVTVSAESQVDGEYQAVEGYRAILWTVAAVIFGVGLLGFVIASVDRALSRRQDELGLHRLGVPERLLARSRMMQALLPLILGVPLAGLSGLLAGTTYLYAADETYVPWRSALVATVVGALLAAATAASTTLRTGRRLGSSGPLRRE